MNIETRGKQMLRKLAPLCLLLLPVTAWCEPSVYLSTSTPTASAPGSFTLSAGAGGSHAIVYVDFYSDGLLLRRDRTHPYTYVYSGLAAGSYTLTATATDTMDESADSNAVTVTVTGGANHAPFATLTSPANNATGLAPASFTLEAEAGDTDGTIANVQFMAGTTVLCTDTTWPYACTYNFVDGGNYALKAVVTDNAGATGASPAVNIVVTWPPNILPTVALTSPYDSAWAYAPATFALGADAADEGGSISKVEFKANGAVIATDTTAPYAFTYASLPAGTYAITATATDNRGAAVTSSAATVTVAAAPVVSLTRTYVYDANQRLCKTINPESGATLVDYDAAGNVAWTAEGTSLTTNTCNRASVTAGQKTTRTYDERNRLKAIITPGGTANVTTTYYADGKVNSLVAANPGGNSVTTTYSYNKRRLLTAETSNNGSTLYALGYGYDVNGNLGAITYPDNQVVSYAPDALGRATKVEGTGGTTYASGITYHPSGAIGGFTYGNGVVHSLTQNSRRLPTRSRDAKGASVVLDDTYAFDENGNVDTITDATPATASNRTRNLGYDGLDRLLVADAPNQWGNATYTYDALDNLRSADQGARQYRYNYDVATNRLSTIKTPAGTKVFDLFYDAAGNTIGKNTQAFVFDSANRLSQVTGQQVYRYDGQGRRVQTTDADTKATFWIYGQTGQVLHTYEARRSQNLSYIYLGNTQVATRAKANTSGVVTVKYQHTDSLGSIVAETDASGAVVKRNSYAPYGEAYAPTVIDGTGYTGHVMDQATGLTYMQQRYYDPQTGRFLSVDPIAANSTNGANFNRYWYANDNPYRFTDPDGRQAVPMKCAQCETAGKQAAVAAAATRNGDKAAATKAMSGVEAIPQTVVPPSLSDGKGFDVSSVALGDTSVEVEGSAAFGMGVKLEKQSGEGNDKASIISGAGASAAATVNAATISYNFPGASGDSRLELSPSVSGGEIVVGDVTLSINSRKIELEVRVGLGVTSGAQVEIPTAVGIKPGAKQ